MMKRSVLPKMNNYGIVFLVFFNVALGINSSHTLKDLCTSTDNQHAIESTIIKSNELEKKRIIRVLNYKYRRNSSENNEFEFHEIKKFSCCQTCSMCKNGVFQLDAKLISFKNRRNLKFSSCSDYTCSNNAYYDYLFRYNVPCKNEQLRELFNDPLEVYNITYEEKAAIPFISGINIYFYPDKEYKCLKLFFESMDSKVRITNRDVNRFFMRFERCATTIRFMTEYNILTYTSYKSYVTGLFYFHMVSFKPSFFAEFKNSDCMKQVFQFELNNNLDGLLSALDINNFSLEKQCLVRLRFFSGFLFNVRVRSSEFVSISTVFTGILVIVNIGVLSVFLKKENRSPVTILLSFLAISDTLTAITGILLTLVAYMFYADYVIKTEVQEWYLDYPNCLVYKYFLIQGDAFNFMSALTTTLLCIQKCLSFMFPVWSKEHLQIKFWTICVVSEMIFTQICFIPWIHGTRQTLRNDNGICLHDMDVHRNLANIWEYYLWTVSVSYCLAVVVVLTCVVYITCQLKRHSTCRRQDYSSVVWSKYRRSAIMVITIGIIFIISDLLHILTWLAGAISFSLPQTYETFGRVYYDNLSFISDLASFCSLGGFLLNFAVYILISEQLRGILYKRVVFVIQKCRFRQ